MDLLDFESEGLYFDEPMNSEVQKCLQLAAESYADGKAEKPLMRAYFLEPEHPMVLVALYRFFYYQHRLQDALLMANRVLLVFARRLDLPEDWRELTENRLANGVLVSMSMLRFYLHALKGAGYLELRLGDFPSALERLEKVVELDSKDHLGAAALIEVARNAMSPAEVDAALAEC